MDGITASARTDQKQMTIIDPEQLKRSPRPAFLWDPARHRIAWANSAAVAWFQEDGLIELQERPFDAREPGVASLAEVARALLADTADHHPVPEEGFAVSLEFPSTGRREALKAHAHLNMLPDGRPGILIVADQPLLAGEERAAPLLREVLEAMPLAVAAIDGHGRLLYANPAAFELFDADALGGLSALFEDTQDLTDFLERAHRAGVSSRTVTASTRFGNRRIRLLARPLDKHLHDGEAFSLILEDITDRYARLESNFQGDETVPSRQRGTTVKAVRTQKNTAGTEVEHDSKDRSLRRTLPLSEEDIAIFQRLSTHESERTDIARETSQNIKEDAAEAAIAKTAAKAHVDEKPAGRLSETDAATSPQKPSGIETDAESLSTTEATESRKAATSAKSDTIQVNPLAPGGIQEKRERPEIPPLVREVLDHRPDPILLHRDGRFHYANAAARTLFGLPLEDPEWDALTEKMNAASEHEPLSLQTKDGVRTFHLRRDVFPWRDGALVQVTLFADKKDAAVGSQELAPSGKEAATESHDKDTAESAGAKESPRTIEGAREDSTSANGSRTEKGDVTLQTRITLRTRRTPVKIVSTRPHQDAERTAVADRPAASPAGKQVHSSSAENPLARQDTVPSSLSDPRVEDADLEPASLAEGGRQQSVPKSAQRPQQDEEQVETPLGSGLCVPETLDEELRAILDTATDGIITLNRKGEILSFSAGAEALFGLSTSEAIGRPFTDLLEGESRKVVADYLDAIASGGHMAAIYNEGREVTARAAGGGKIPLFITIGKLGRNDEAERPDNKAAFCVVVRDITQWKKTESELRRAKEAAERSSAQKTEFLAAISHELRTPLNAILGFSDVMRNERFGAIGNEKYKGYANDIYQSGEHLLSLINDLLDLSRIEAGKFEMRFAEVDIKAVAEEALQMMQEQAAQAHVILRRSIPDDLPRVVADARALKQILLNLLSNAVKFTEAGGQVMLSARTTHRGELEIVVRDTGIGMSEEELKRALRPFERITGKGRKEKPGTGLGLPLTKALTEANHASFEIDSAPGKGTRVRIVFPTQRVLA